MGWKNLLFRLGTHGVRFQSSEIFASWAAFHISPNLAARPLDASEWQSAKCTMKPSREIASAALDQLVRL